MVSQVESGNEISYEKNAEVASINVEEVGKAIQEDPGAGTKPNLSPKEALEQYLSDPDVKKNSLFWAKKMLTDVSKNWFAVDRVIKKTIFKTEKDALGILQVMCLMGLCHVDTKDGKLRYKITLNPADKIALLGDQLVEFKAEYDKKASHIMAEIERLKESK